MILITGGSGQLGIELLRHAWPNGFEIHAPPRDQLDITSPDLIRAAISAEPWACVINAAAYTAVDAAESDPEAAFAANSVGPGWLADETARAAIPLIHVSTDYVFSGKAGRPYTEGDLIDPINAYGASKAEGEKAVLAANPRSIIVRTAWLVSAHGSNFLKSILRLADERSQLDVVDDQRGSPTAAADLASAIAAIAVGQVEDPGAPSGIYHYANAGDATRYELAEEILRQSDARGGPSAEVRPIASSEHPTPARRPPDTRLATGKITRDFDIVPRDWRDAVADIIAELDERGELRKVKG